MRASDFETLFRYEEPIERAVVQVLTAAGLSAFRSRDRAGAKTPFVTAKLIPGGETGHKGQYLPGRFMSDAFHGHLLLSVYTARADDEQASPGAAAVGTALNPDHGPDKHALLVGQVRVLMLYASAKFTEANLPFHYLEQIQDAGVAARVDEDTGVDVSPLLYKVVFGIRPSAWPLPPAP